MKANEVEVILRDFDGTRTIFSTELPLRDIIHSAITDMAVTIDKTYERTTEQDEHGRTVYAEVR